MWRPFLRGVLAGLLILSLAWSGVSLWHLSRAPLGGWLVERAEAQLEAAYDRALARHATTEALSDLILLRLNETPRNWVALEGLRSLAEAQDLAVRDEVLDAYAAAHARDFGMAARAQSCVACGYDLRQCSMGAELACGIGVNLTVAGDVLSLGRESGAWLRGDTVDQVDVTLSFIGIGATGLAVATGGTSLLVKTGAGTLKVAHRMGRLTPGVRRIYARAFRDGVDWARLPAIRNADELAQLGRMEALRPALQMTEHLGVMQARLGTRGALHLVGSVDDLADASRMARATGALGPRSVGALEVLGKSRFLRTGLRLADQVRDAVAGLLAAISATLGLIWSRLLRKVRRSLA